MPAEYFRHRHPCLLYTSLLIFAAVSDLARPEAAGKLPYLPPIGESFTYCGKAVSVGQNVIPCKPRRSKIQYFLPFGNAVSIGEKDVYKRQTVDPVLDHVSGNFP